MAISFTKKKVAASNEKLALSNKHETLPDKPPTPNLTGSPTEVKAAWSPTPFIDKISVVVEPAHDQDAHDIYNGLFTYFHDHDVFLDVKGGKWGEYKVAKKIALDSVTDFKKLPLLQCAYEAKMPDKPGKALKIRIEFVPVDLGWEGMAHLNAALVMVMPSGWNYVMKNGHITRLDVAVDFPDVLMDEFHFMPLQGATTKQWRMNGKLQTYTHGKPQGNHTAIYDRKEKRKAHKQPWIGKEGMRIERRIKAPPITMLKDLVHLPNPFTAMNMVSMPISPPPESQKFLFIWDLFRKAAEANGLTAALALLPEERRTLYRKHLAANIQPWWNPDAIWANWPAMLDELKIGSPGSWL